jgi:steroid delta-isomerase-like uncharacterized protein
MVKEVYMAVEDIQLVKRWFDEVWNNGNLDAIDELLATDAIGHGLGEAGKNVIGPEAFKPFVQRLRGAFPDMHISVDDTISEGDKIAARFTATMTHQGDDLGMPATGKHVTVSGICFTRISNGQIVEGWNCWDIYGMMQQLEAPSAPITLLD